MTDSLTFDVYGDGPGLVLLHGTSSTGLGSWGTVLSGLAAEFTVVLPNLPGSAGSPLPDGPLDLDTVSDQIVTAAREAGVERFAVAGVSLGAPLAVHIAARRPELVTRLGTFVGFSRARPVLRLNLELWADLYARGDAALGKFIAMLSFSETYLAGLPEDAVAQVLQQVAAIVPEPGTAAQIDLALRLDVREDQAGVRVPALVVTSSEDRFVAPAHSYELAAEIPGARLVETEGGHASLFENPQRSLTELLKFFEG